MVVYILLLLCTFGYLSAASINRTEPVCGFPGNPLNGIVKEGDVDVTNATRRTFNGSVTYLCDSDFILIQHSDTERSCVDGSWTGKIPHCASQKRIGNVTYTEKNVTLTHDFDSSECTSFVNQDFVIPVDSEEQANGLRVESSNRSVYQVWAFLNRTQNYTQLIRHEQKHSEDDQESAIFLMSNRSEQVLSFALRFQSGDICGLQTLYVADTCGHPDSIVDGDVNWTPDRATYGCNVGYRLQPKNKSFVRRCINGQWVDKIPTCRIAVDAHLQKVGHIFIGTTCGAALIIFFIVVMCYSRKRRTSSVELGKNHKH